MTRTSLVLDDRSLTLLRRLSRQLDASQSEVVRRSLQLLEQRAAAAPTSPADALKQLASLPGAQHSWGKVKSRIRRQRADRHAADEARG